MSTAHGDEHDRNLVKMANQIAMFFEAQSGPKAPADVADHLRKFWDPRMRKAIFAYVDRGGDGLQPLVLKAVQTLKAATTPA